MWLLPTANRRPPGERRLDEERLRPPARSFCFVRPRPLEAPRGSAPPVAAFVFVASSASAAGVANVQSAEQAQTSRHQQALKGAGKQAVVERRPVVENPQPQQSRKVRMQRLRACLVKRTTGVKVVWAGYNLACPSSFTSSHWMQQ